MADEECGQLPLWLYDVLYVDWKSPGLVAGCGQGCASGNFLQVNPEWCGLTYDRARNFSMGTNAIHARRMGIQIGTPLLSLSPVDVHARHPYGRYKRKTLSSCWLHLAFNVFKDSRRLKALQGALTSRMSFSPSPQTGRLRFTAQRASSLSITSSVDLSTQIPN
jgi:hypothetical protein